MPLLRSTSAANVVHVDSSRAFTVYVGSDIKFSLTGPPHKPFRPELEAVLGGWPLSQLTQCVDDSSCLLVTGVVAVLGCCIGLLAVLSADPAGTRYPLAEDGGRYERSYVAFRGVASSPGGNGE